MPDEAIYREADEADFVGMVEGTRHFIGEACRWSKAAARRWLAHEHGRIDLPILAAAIAGTALGWHAGAGNPVGVAVLGLAALSALLAWRYRPTRYRQLAELPLSEPAQPRDSLGLVHALELVEDRDSLTGLPGKAALKLACRRLLRHSTDNRQRVALISFDLDRMKDINGCWGYRVGDEVLRHVARRLALDRNGDIFLSRIDGDRFAVVVPDIADMETARTSAERALDRLSRTLVIDGSEISPSASIGVALYPDHGSGFDQLMRCAELAVDEAKREGGGRVRSFDPRMDHSLKARKAMEQELRRALEAGDLALHYQPQFDLTTGEVVACEALIRWHHPVRGMIPPIDFIPLAETTGLIRPIGTWVIQEACRAARRWQDAGLPLRVAVNCSAAQLKQQEILPILKRALVAAGITADRLELEVTESLFVDPTQVNIRRCLDEIAALGVALAIDDFGTGYSSLSYLKRLPVGRIKIDKSFLRGVGREALDDHMVRVIIGLAKAFGRKVMAEGVETEAQLRFLEQEGCDEAQGYLYTKPLTETDCTKFLLSSARLAA